MSTSIEDIMKDAHEVREALEREIKVMAVENEERWTVKPLCGFYGSKVVHFDWCRCDEEYQEYRDFQW